MTLTIAVLRKLGKKKKSQAAVEYLQTYGWAILVIVIIGIAIWKLGILGPYKGVNTVSGFTVIRILEPSIVYKPNTDLQALQFKIMNARGLKIEISRDVEISGDCHNIVLKYIVETVGSEEDCDGIYFPGEVGGTCWKASNTKLEPGAIFEPITYCDKLAPGEQFEVKIKFRYYERVGKGQVTRYDKGIIRGYVEKK
jgi:hypothetical protein